VKQFADAWNRAGGGADGFAEIMSRPEPVSPEEAASLGARMGESMGVTSPPRSAGMSSP